jgi:hypothetical protein
MAVDTQHRGKWGEIRKHGNTLIGTLRKTYGPDFAKGCAESVYFPILMQQKRSPSFVKSDYA